MAEGKCINPAEFKLLGFHLCELGSACDALKQLGIEIVNDADDSLPGESVKLFAAKAGWLADECARILKSSPGPVNGTWEDWSLSPVAKEALNAINHLKSEAGIKAKAQVSYG